MLRQKIGHTGEGGLGGEEGSVCVGGGGGGREGGIGWRISFI